MTADPVVAEEVKQWSEPLDAYQKEVIGETLVYLEGDRYVCRMEECNMGMCQLDN